MIVSKELYTPKVAVLLGLMIGGLGVGIAKGATPAIALTPVPALAVGYAIASSRKHRQVEAAQTEIKRAQDEIERLVRGRKWDGEEIANLVKSLEEHKIGLARAADTILAATQTRNKLNNELSTVKEGLGTLRAQLAAARAEIKEWEEEWEERLATESENLYQQRKMRTIARVEGDCDSIANEAMDCLEKVDELLHLGKALNDDKGEVSNRAIDRLSSLADSLTKTSSEELSAYLEQIELLNIKIARLQRENEGEILEPRYIEPAYDINARIANDIARCLWEQSHVALSVLAFEENKSGEVAVGLGYSATPQPHQLLARLNSQVGAVRSRLGIAHLSKLSKPGHINAFELRFRREPKAKEDDIKRLFAPIETLTGKIIAEMDTKPTIRIMGATGDGKGVCARVLLSAILSEVSGWAVRLHDPQDGSDEDYWGISKVSRSGREMKASLKAIVQQLEDREAGEASNAIATFDVLDEVDTQLKREEKSDFLDLISRIRHHRMKLMLIGQNPKVSRAGFQWSDMAQMVAIYMGNTAIDAIESHPSIKRSKGSLPEQYDLIREWVERENQLFPSSRKYHWGLCYLPSQKEPIWFLLPPAEDIVINPGDNTVLSEFGLGELMLAERNGQTNSNLAKNSTDKTRQNRQNGLTRTDTVAVSGTAEIQSEKGLAPLSSNDMTIPYVGVGDKTGILASPTCKYHPTASLTQHKNGAYYCPECRRKLRKRDEVIWVERNDSEVKDS